MRVLNLSASFLLTLLATFFVLHKLNYPLSGIDDANIYFVYGRNFAQGHGFIYNVGGERVEGFTSLLWTLIAALAFRFSTHPELTLLIVNIVLVSLGSAVALQYLQAVTAGDGNRIRLLWSAIFLFLLFTSPRYIAWNTITLMENGLWSSMLLAATVFVLKDQLPARSINYGFIPLAALLLLTRPEAMVWMVVFAAIVFLRRSFADGYLMAWRTIVPSVAGIGLTLLSLTLFRVSYFGYPLPNTYYAKVSPSLMVNVEAGILYLVRYFVSDRMASVLVLVALGGCLHTLLRLCRRQFAANEPFFLPVIAAAGLLMPLLTGGDHFGSFRFYQNIYPISLLCLILTVRWIMPQLARQVGWFRMQGLSRVALSVGLSVSLAAGYSWDQRGVWSDFSSEIEREFMVGVWERNKGVFLESLFAPLPRLPSVGVVASGGIKYSYPGEIVDLMGLNNTVMAHNHGQRLGFKNHAAFEKETFFVLQPDIVLPRVMEADKWRYSEAELKNRWENTLAFRGLFDEPQFLELYQYAQVERRSGGQPDDLILVAWFRWDFLDYLKSNGDFTVVVYQYGP